MTTRTTVVGFAVVWLVACGGRPQPEPQQSQAPAKDLGTQVGDTASDTAVMKEANDAANTVIRAGADCDAAKAAMPAANKALDEAAAKLRTSTGRVTLEVLRKQLRTIADACP